jgi:hypothetical protein
MTQKKCMAMCMREKTQNKHFNDIGQLFCTKCKKIVNNEKKE